MVKNPPASGGRRKRRRLDPWVGKIPCSRKWQPTPVFLPGKLHGQRSLAGYSTWHHRGLDMTERLNTHKQIFPPCFSFLKPFFFFSLLLPTLFFFFKNAVVMLHLLHFLIKCGINLLTFAKRKKERERERGEGCEGEGR